MMEKLTRLALISLGILSAIILVFCFIEYVLPILIPFLIAWIVASLTASLAERLAKRIKAPRRIIRLVLSVLLTLIFAAVAILSLWRTLASLWQFLADISEKNRLYDLLNTILSRDIPLLGKVLPEELASRIGEAFGSLISTGLSFVAEWITSLAGAVPKILLFLLVTLISLVYFSLDYDKINSFVSSHLPRRLSILVKKLRTGITVLLKKYILSYSLILLITYITLLIGFVILRVDRAMLLAFLIAILDILPVIGVGTVLIPWSIYELAVGNSTLGIGLIILFVANAVIRQLAEPKIIGKSLDLHPLITLITLYVGYAVFGIWGMLLLPIATVLIITSLKGNNTAEIG